MTDREYCPPLPAVGQELVRVIASEPGSDHEIYTAYVLAMRWTALDVDYEMSGKDLIESVKHVAENATRFAAVPLT